MADISDLPKPVKTDISDLPVPKSDVPTLAKTDAKEIKPEKKSLFSKEKSEGKVNSIYFRFSLMMLVEQSCLGKH